MGDRVVLFAMQRLSVFLLFSLWTIENVSARNLSATVGVAGAGWLHLEDWMFSFPMGRGLPSADYQYDLVDTQRGSPQGRLFPSDVVQAHPFTPATNATVEPWYCEGDLTTATTARIGAAATIDAFVKHRTTYWSEQDLVTMASHGVNTVRLNVGWWAFHSF